MKEFACPLPADMGDTVQLSHGGGGVMIAVALFEPDPGVSQ